MLKTKIKKGKKKIIAAVVIVLVTVAVALVFFISKKNKMEENMQEAFRVETAQIQRQTLTDSISATGTVESAETKTVNTSLKDIEIVAVHVKEGDYVEEGTIICEFDAADYEEALAKAEHNAAVNKKLDALNGDYVSAYDKAVAEAEEGLQDMRSDRDEARDDYVSAVDQLNVKAEELRAARAAYDAIADELTAEEKAVESYKAAYENAQTALASAQINLSLAQESADAAAIASAQQAYEQAKADAAAEEAVYRTAKTRYDELSAVQNTYEKKQQEYASAEQNLESSKSAYEQAQSRREEYQDTYENAIEKAKDAYDKAALESQLITESQEEKEIDEYTELIEDCVVKAAMSGVITSLNVTEGNIFEGGDVYTIQDNNHFIVSSTVDEYDIASIEKGMTAYIKTDATGDAEMKGEVTYVAIAPVSTGGAMGAVSSSASYRVEVTIEDPDENLRAGMTAKLSISLEESENVLTVPYDAVTTAPDGTSSIKVDMDGEQKTITVETGLETDYYTEVFSDELEEGMTVYLNTPMTSVTPDKSDGNGVGFGGGMMPGGGMPSRGNDRGGTIPGGGSGGRF